MCSHFIFPELLWTSDRNLEEKSLIQWFIIKKHKVMFCIHKKLVQCNCNLLDPLKWIKNICVYLESSFHIKILIIRLISNSFSVEVSFPPLTQLIWNVQNVVKRNVYSLCCKSETKSSARGLFYNQSKHYCKTVFSLSSLDLLLSLIQQCTSFFQKMNSRIIPHNSFFGIRSQSKN